jgi:hypothetical protein
VTRVPNHIPALMRLVEICVDGGLEATMFSAQSQLADAYIAAGAATEALFIAEDLVAREPWDNANLERFRRALELSGEPNPDALIASRLSGESPFTSTDLLLAGDSQLFEPTVDVKTEEEPAEQIDVEEPVVEEPPVKKPPKAQPKRHPLEAHQFQLSANAIDLDSILGDLDSPAVSPAGHAESDNESESVELDLSLMLDDSATPPPKKSGTGG